MLLREQVRYLFLITVIFIAACVETDIYLPAFPDMMNAFSVSESAIQGLLTWNFVGICVSGPFYGPLSDAFGRKKPLIVALVLFLLGSLLTVITSDFSCMLAGRVLQGLGSGGCFTLGTAILFDAFQKEKAIQALNQLNMIIPLIMSIAPMLGGYLNYVFGFRSNFLAITFLVFLSLALCFFFFQETLPKKKRTPFAIRSVGKSFTQVLKSTLFWQVTIAISLLFGGYIAFLSYTSVFFVAKLGISKQFSPFFQILVLGAWTIGGLVLKKILTKVGNDNVKKMGIFLCLLGGFSFILASIFASNNPYVLTGCLLPYIFGANWVFGLYFPEVMELMPDIKGVVSSILTSVRLLIAAFVVALASTCYNETIYPLTWVILSTVVILLPSLLWYEKKIALMEKRS